MAKRLSVLLGLMLVVSCGATAADSGEPASVASPPGMVLIPAGSFQMGDAFNEGWSDERPVHTVNVSAFYMDEYEATKALWDEVAAWAQANGYEIGPGDGSGKAADHPVYDVTWYEAVKWANARSERERLTPCYAVSGSVYRSGQSAPDCNWSANGYRLPTEAESVWEWCWDWYSGTYYKSSPGIDPRGPASASRAFRGGGYYNIAFYCRVGFRYIFRPAYEIYDDMGFRAVLSPGQ